jgi:adenylate kinase
MNIVLMGPPGSGKSTQAACLADRLGIPQVAAGDLLRAELRAGSPLGQAAQPYLEAGDLVPDDLVSILVLHRLQQPDCATGMVFDGFPRTVPQAEALRQASIAIDYVVEITLDEEEIVQRLAGRWIHPASGRTYHVRFHPPKVANRDDLTGEPLVQRADDREAAIRRRLLLYRSETSSVLAYYAREAAGRNGAPPRHLMTSGEGRPNEICARILAAVRQPSRP